MRPSDIAARIKRLGLTQARLAEIAQLDPNTVGRALKAHTPETGGPFRSTMNRIETAVTARELDLMRVLVRAYPQEANAALCPECPAAQGDGAAPQPAASVRSALA